MCVKLKKKILDEINEKKQETTNLYYKKIINKFIPMIRK